MELMLTNHLSPRMKINGEGEDFQFGMGFGLVTDRNRYFFPVECGFFFLGWCV